MFFAFNARQATKLARSLEKALSPQNIALSHGQALDTLARMQGFTDWNSWKRQLDEKGWNEQLCRAELDHAEASAGDQYGSEAALIAHTGFELRYDTDGELLTYVRVCDPLGRELAYWTYDEWQEDPQLVMGAIIGALVRGQPAPVGRDKSQRMPAPASAKAQATPQPLITDVDFMKAYALLFSGQCYRIGWREGAALAYVGQVHAPDYDQWAGAKALQLYGEGDQQDWRKSVTVAELTALQWSAENKCFMDANGEHWRFFIETEFGVDAPVRESRGQLQPVQQPSAKKEAQEPKPPRRFRVTVNIRSEHGSCSPLGTRVCIAPSEAEACNRVREVLWDDRLDAASCSAQVESEALDDDEDGPFTVFVDGGPYETTDSFAKAWRVAQFMLRAVATESVQVEDNDCKIVLELRH